MNVIISGKNKEIIDKLDIEVIKRLDGEFTVDEIIASFQNMFFNRMIIDITAIKDYQDIRNIQKLSISFDMNKVILLLDPQSNMATPEFLSKIISMGIYNFTTNIEGLTYLYNNPNSYKDVAQYHSIDSMIVDEPDIPEEQPNLLDVFNVNPTPEREPFIQTSVGMEETPVQSNGKKRIIGIKSITPGAGATTLTHTGTGSTTGVAAGTGSGAGAATVTPIGSAVFGMGSGTTGDGAGSTTRFSAIKKAQ